MSVYADTSILVSSLTQEIGSVAADRWLDAVAPGELVSSPWCYVEAASAFVAKVRLGLLTDEAGQRRCAEVDRLIAESARLIQVRGRHFRSAAELLTGSEKPLRASDALHLAIAMEEGVVLWTLDRRMADAGQGLGLGTRLLTA